MPQHVPLAVIDAPPSEVIVAPSVAVVVVIAVAVGNPRVGAVVAEVTTTLTVAVASVVPALEHVMVNICVLAGIAERSSDPPLATLDPLQKFEAVHESGLPVVVHVNVVEPGAVSGPGGVAEMLTVIAPTGVTVAEDAVEFPPAFVHVIV